MGGNDNCINLLESYFENRNQQCEIGSTRGNKIISDRGVLQGSGLSPILFVNLPPMGGKKYKELYTMHG